MSLLGKRKNKKFNYRPRYYEQEGEGSPFEMEHKFDKFRTTVGENKNLKGKFNTAWGDFRKSSDTNTRKRLWIIIVVLILIFLFIIEFDLSIFYA